MYLYLVECVVRKQKSGGKNPIKIGIATNLNRRLCQLQVGNPFKLRYIAVIRKQSKKEALKLEKELHKHFYYSRMIGEWFTPKITGTQKFIDILLESQKQLMLEMIPDVSDMGVKSLGKSRGNMKLY